MPARTGHKLVAVQLPTELAEWMQAEARHQRRTQKEVIVEALVRYQLGLAGKVDLPSIPEGTLPAPLPRGRKAGSKVKSKSGANTIELPEGITPELLQAGLAALAREAANAQAEEQPSGDPKSN